ncbi:hypothetical protein JTE90_001398 [Oedothorax gibbosus]|uniref:Uncharacterized protein n=1 Tax=Oedothorax gibbosus TaxID=931172 RepID=A0AAV6VFW9_9ARAC|nr:hypothetical protein JTE90_001398 [Oedothorax gibbosus]
MKELSKTNEDRKIESSILKEKDILNSKWQDICNSLQSIDECKLLKRHLKSFESLLKASRTCETPGSIPAPTCSRKRKIEPQRRLFKTRKEKKKKENLIVKPSVEEKQQIAASLLLQYKQVDPEKLLPVNSSSSIVLSEELNVLPLGMGKGNIEKQTAQVQTVTPKCTTLSNTRRLMTDSGTPNVHPGNMRPNIIRLQALNK